MVVYQQEKHGKRTQPLDPVPKKIAEDILQSIWVK
jgi:hypothetical protein